MEEYDRMKEVKEFDDSKMGVKGLLDKGITTIPRFFQHPPLVQNLPTTCSSQLHLQVPTIDLSGVLNPNKRAEIVDQIREAASTWGFFQIVNHSIPLSVLNSTIDAIKSFHELPQDVKRSLYVRNQPVSYYSNLDLFLSKAAGWIDTLAVSMPLEQPFLDQIPEICREELLSWYEHVEKLADAVTELLCEGLGLKATRFKELKYLGETNMVGHYYPYCPQPDLTMGIPSHTDKEVITVLLQNHNGGLQVKYGEEWVDVKPVPGALVINIGDFLQMISNDAYKSGEHRALANPLRDPRISIATFFGATEDETVWYEPLEELLSPGNPPLYRKFKVSEIRNRFFNQDLTKSLLQYFKL